MSPVPSVLSLLSISLWWAMSASAPLPESSGDPELDQFVQKNREFVIGIKKEVVKIRERMRRDFKIGSNSELVLVHELLSIPQVDLSHCRADPCDMGGCYNQIRAGLHTYDGYFSHIKGVLSNYAGDMDTLQAHVNNLSSNLEHQMQVSGLTMVTYPETESQAPPSFLQNESQVGSYLVLGNFQKFLEMTFRALRHCRS